MIKLSVTTTKAKCEFQLINLLSVILIHVCYHFSDKTILWGITETNQAIKHHLSGSLPMNIKNVKAHNSLF